MEDCLSICIENSINVIIGGDYSPTNACEETDIKHLLP